MGTSAKKQNITKIIWIDPNVDSEENEYYLKELKKLKNKLISPFKDIESALKFIKKLIFSETYIIISGSLYNDFIEQFKKNLKKIFIIPKIIIFTSNKERFLDNNKNYNDNYNSFYNVGGIQTSFKDVKNFVSKPLPIIKKNTIEEGQLTFEYINSKEQIVLPIPMFYQYLIDSVSTNNIEKCTEYIYNKYNTNEEIKNLLYPIKNIPEIPIELLSKYYAKLYTIESQFYVDINRELREKQREKYLSYIKLLYEGVRLESLPITSNNEILYRRSKISNDEVIKIKKY